ncbi:hypothetical protein [Macrococcus brunensis]|uniref:hypothetical protein n=1 Tax=Macrococcus brunensis TaxID=198483 RepID=UPI001EEF792D|nr:hypothetical protein [Macrococcus brunensis]ULG73576.1 hypothetical protein MGG13_07660 [Macrococcus brunensis]
MEKLAVSTIAVVSLLAVQPSANAAVSEKALPDLTNKTTISQIKAGTYSFKGINFNSTRLDVIKKLGKPQNESFGRSIYGSNFDSSYDNYAINIGGESHDRYSNFDKMKVSYLNFSYADSRYSYQSLKSLLGKPKDTIIIDNETKDIKDDQLMQQYDHFIINYNRLSGKWMVENIMIAKEIKEQKTISKPGKLLNKNIKKLSAADYQAMKAGRFKLEGVKPGMTKEQVYKLIGESTSEIVIKDGELMVSADYGKGSTLSFEYSSKNLKADVNKLKLEQMIFMNFDENVRLADVQKIIGKPTSTTKDSYVLSEDGKNDRHVNTMTLKYGRHLEITAEKLGKYWTVVNVTYL